mmetsp:Transcript_5874/g.17122  ORF Transcript_5874/g.17122 Transcript_5874/m.17122 type:complete len:317 (-) Transcript_5874:225-1175(-)
MSMSCPCLVPQVQYMHDQGVIHRDLKLENVLLNHADDCKVCDFGLAHLFRRERGKIVREQLKEICGSKSYAAPDVLVGRGYDGAATDIWSCGICLFGCLAGFFPLDGATTQDWRFVRVCKAVIQGHSLTRTVFSFYNRECPLSAEAVHLIDGMLSLNPTKRFTITDILSHPWLRKRRAVSFGQENMRIPEFKRKGVINDLPDYRTPYRTSVAAAAAVAAATGAGGSAGFVVPTGGQTIGHQESMDLEEYGRLRHESAGELPNYRGSAGSDARISWIEATAVAPDLGPTSSEGAGPPLSLQRQHAFLGALPEGDPRP